MRCSEWKSIGKGKLERQEPLPAAWEVIGEEEVHCIPLVGRKRDALAVEFHPGIHQRQAEPGIRAGHKLAIELEVETCCMTAAFVLSVINYLYIADRVGHQIAQCLIVGFCRELVSLFIHLEPVVVTGNEVDASLTLDLPVERGDGYSIDARGISQLLEERCLIIKSCSETERRVLMVCRNDSEGDAWAQDGFPIEVPMAQTKTIVQCIACLPDIARLGRISSASEMVSVLKIGFYAVGIQLVSSLHGIVHIEVFSGVRNAVSGRISHLVFYGIFFDVLPLQCDCSLQIMLLYLVFQHQLGTHHTGREIVAGMFEVSSYT